MQNIEFKNLIIDIYNRFSVENLNCIVFSKETSFVLESICDIKDFINRFDITGLYLESKLTNTSINLKCDELENYKVKESEYTIYIKCKNRMEVCIMY